MEKATRGISTEHIQERFAEWRRTRAKKARIPDELWETAIEVARRDGVNRTAQALHLDGGKLMRRLVAAGHEPPAKREETPMAFVEIVSSQAEIRIECAVEAERPGAGRVRVELKSVTMREVAELSRALLSLS
jgi:hypothetical protein